MSNLDYMNYLFYNNHIDITKKTEVINEFIGILDKTDPMSDDYQQQLQILQNMKRETDRIVLNQLYNYMYMEEQDIDFGHEYYEP